MKEFWNERYASEEFAYGKKPNVFLKETLETYHPTGNLLLPAEGEGRNAIYAAQIGLNVYAFDISEEAQRKALKYAKNEGLTIDYQLGSLNTISYKSDFFDAVALIYAHFPPGIRSDYHVRIGQLLKPGGLVILEGFSEQNLEYREKNPSIGGPPSKEMLFNKEMIQKEFANFSIVTLEEVVVHLDEGKFHKGMGSVIRFIGRKM